MIGVTRVKGEIQREEGMSREKGMKLPTLDGDLGISSTCAGGHVSSVYRRLIVQIGTSSGW